MKKFVLLLYLLTTIPACAGQRPIDDESDNVIIDFAESTQIIRMLLQSNSLKAIIEDANPESLNFLINNFSPAQIALESEVLSCTQPVVIYFYADIITHGQLLYALAHEYKDTIKVITLDVEKFPKIAQETLIENYPAIMVIYKRQEIYRDETVSNTDSLIAILEILKNQEESDEA
jgi:thioredoxin-like negative regulator of GroEL